MARVRDLFLPFTEHSTTSFYCTFACLFLFPSLLFAAPDSSVCESVKVDVRTVMGSKSLDQAAMKTPTVDPKIEDLKVQLAHLHYADYKMLAHRSVVVPVTSKRVIRLSDGHRLTLRPIYANAERVGMWMKWNDRSGEKVLDTRLHFDCMKNVLTGLETNEDKGLILAIKVTPIMP